jgi:hypothetical protein
MMSIDISKPLTEMETLAWASMTEDELVEKLSDELWKAAPRSGHVGVSLSKAKLFTRRYVLGIRSRKKRSKIRRLIHERARSLFIKQCYLWADEVRRSVCYPWPPRKVEIRQAVRRIVPKGAHKEVYDLIASRIRWN